MTALVEQRCARCGSTDVTRDAVVRWDVDAQDWSLSNVFDNADCDDCGGETRLVEAPVNPVRMRLCAMLDRVTVTAYCGDSLQGVTSRAALGRLLRDHDELWADREAINFALLAGDSYAGNGWTIARG